MAADPRQFTEHNEVGGVNVYLEDKRMSELKSATGKTASQISTADEYIPLQDTDGNLVKINPASFQEAVRNVLGSLLANNDKGTTISGIPALSGSGASLDFGSVTPANLASVLGGKVLVYSGWMDASQSIDSLVTNKVGLYIVTNKSHTGDNDSLFFVGSETVTGLHTGSVCRITLSISNGKLFITSSDTTAALVSVSKLG